MRTTANLLRGTDPRSLPHEIDYVIPDCFDRSLLGKWASSSFGKHNDRKAAGDFDRQERTYSPQFTIA